MKKMRVTADGPEAYEDPPHVLDNYDNIQDFIEDVTDVRFNYSIQMQLLVQFLLERYSTLDPTEMLGRVLTDYLSTDGIATALFDFLQEHDDPAATVRQMLE